VEICDKSYFDKLGLDYGSARQLTADVVAEFKLNEEQERAFRIVSQHSVSATPYALRMYIGGMGGTGKSQVVKALIQFFALRKMRYAIVTTAPTGNAAALLGGSTYHFLLGINNQVEEVPRATMSEVCARLEGIEYVVLDEVSMLACIDIYKISEQM
ncbi:hypothetical protein F5877DRAFT_28943, partial [Lentinula edodes]